MSETQVETKRTQGETDWNTSEIQVETDRSTSETQLYAGRIWRENETGPNTDPREAQPKWKPSEHK